jgi:hypothetical protein
VELRRKALGIYAAVISHLRPGNVEPMTRLIGPATWYVGNGEATAYAEAGAAMVVESGGLCPSRNAALRDAWASGLPCLQLSDDLKRIRKAPEDTPMSFDEAVALMRDRTAEHGFPLAGVAPTANAYFYSKPVTTDGFVVGDMILVQSCGVFFDESLRLKEDYDYTLQHFRDFGGAVRCNEILATFAHRTNPGGACAVRTSKLERASIDRLKAKWGERIKDNPRRPDEILLAKPSRR